MQPSEAIQLIKHTSLHGAAPATWADLGCGTGLFTYALASQLHRGSTIYAIDNDARVLKSVPHLSGITIIERQQDFITDELNLQDLDGILMANSLHYVKDKIAFLKRMMRSLKPAGSFLIVEYDTDVANHWVPYPLNFVSLTSLFESLGYTSITKLGEHPSVFRRANIYGALIRAKKQSG